MSLIFDELFDELSPADPADSLNIQRYLLASLLADYRFDGFVRRLEQSSSASDTRLLLLLDNKIKALQADDDYAALPQFSREALSRMQRKTSRKLRERSEHVKSLFRTKTKQLPGTSTRRRSLPPARHIEQAAQLEPPSLDDVESQRELDLD